MPKILEKPDIMIYKPFRFPKAFEIYETAQSMHWLPKEVTMAEDVKDWSVKLSPYEKELIIHIFRFFVQADVIVGDAYLTHFINRFHFPEIRMMMSAFATAECNHIVSYAHLIDTLGLPEVEYSKFMEYQEMKDKYEYSQTFDTNNIENLMHAIAGFSAFTEGLQLYASFAILFNFARHNKMKGMGQIVTWSSRDENLHCSGMLYILNQLKQDYPHAWTPELQARIYEVCKTIIQHEDAFIDMAFGDGELEDLTANDVKRYIRYIANRRLYQLELTPIYDIRDNPLPWMDDVFNADEYANFFEVRSTAYSKSAMSGDYGEDAFTLD